MKRMRDFEGSRPHRVTFPAAGVHDDAPSGTRSRCTILAQASFQSSSAMILASFSHLHKNYTNQ
jgi:hypothetical protein